MVQSPRPPRPINTYLKKKQRGAADVVQLVVPSMHDNLGHLHKPGDLSSQEVEAGGADCMTESPEMTRGAEVHTTKGSAELNASGKEGRRPRKLSSDITCTPLQHAQTSHSSK